MNHHASPYWEIQFILIAFFSFCGLYSKSPFYICSELRKIKQLTKPKTIPVFFPLLKLTLHIHTLPWNSIKAPFRVGHDFEIITRISSLYARREKTITSLPYNYDNHIEKYHTFMVKTQICWYVYTYIQNGVCIRVFF